MFVTIDSAAGASSAPPKPWSARAAMSCPSLVARPPRSEATENTKRPAMNNRRRPRRSASRPPSNRKPPNVSTYALMTHARLSCEKPSSLPTVGRATFTIAASSTMTNWVVARSARANSFWRWVSGASSVMGGAAGARGLT